MVALYAMLRVAEAGMQAALMAPTETLAEQHFATLERLIAADLFAGAEATRLGPPIGLLTGSTPARERRERARAPAHRRAAARWSARTR